VLVLTYDDTISVFYIQSNLIKLRLNWIRNYIRTVESVVCRVCTDCPFVWEDVLSSLGVTSSSRGRWAY